MKKRIEIENASGKLGILLPGMGAVATTLVAGIYAVRQGFGKPIGSLTQMGTIRLGKRTEKRVPLIKEFVPLSPLDDLIFGDYGHRSAGGIALLSSVDVCDRTPAVAHTFIRFQSGHFGFGIDQFRIQTRE